MLRRPLSHRYQVTLPQPDWEAKMSQASIECNDTPDAADTVKNDNDLQRFVN